MKVAVIIVIIVPRVIMIAISSIICMQQSSILPLCLSHTT